MPPGIGFQAVPLKETSKTGASDKVITLALNPTFMPTALIFSIQK